MAVPQIPYLDLGREGPLALVRRESDRADAILRAGRKQYGGITIDLLDRLSRRWARSGGGLFLTELESAAAEALPRGIWFMNHAYEWGCTTSAGADPEGEGVRLLRTLDWPFDGLGKHVVVVRQETDVGAPITT